MALILEKIKLFFEMIMNLITNLGKIFREKRYLHEYQYKQLIKQESGKMGHLVEVDGNLMNVFIYNEDQDKTDNPKNSNSNSTLVFISGFGTASPILDFSTLYRLLSKQFNIVVIEKFGYGFSDIVDSERSVATQVRQDREALTKAGLQGPWILVPHSRGAYEAIYWAQHYPEEVEAFVGLDITMPYPCTEMEAQRHRQRVTRYRFNSLFFKLHLPPMIDYAQQFIFNPHMNESEQKLYKALYYKNAYNSSIQQESSFICENISTILQYPTPFSTLPTLLFCTRLSQSLNKKIFQDKQIFPNLNFKILEDTSKTTTTDNRGSLSTNASSSTSASKNSTDSTSSSIDTPTTIATFGKMGKLVVLPTNQHYVHNYSFNAIHQELEEFIKKLN